MLQLQETDGTPLQPFNFGAVLPGSTSSAKLFKLVNIGGVAYPAPFAWLTQASVLDGELQVTIGNVAVTATTEGEATILPALAAGASLNCSAVFVSPVTGGVPVDTGLLHIKAF